MGTTKEGYVLLGTNPASIIIKNNNCATTYLPSHKPPKLDEQNMPSNAGEVKTNSSEMFANGLLFLDAPVMDDQQRITYINCVPNRLLYHYVADRFVCVSLRFKWYSDPVST